MKEAKKCGIDIVGETEMKKKTYTVTIIATVEAKNKREAHQIAYNMAQYGAEETAHNTPHSGLKSFCIGPAEKLEY